MTILDEIVAAKRREVEQKKQELAVSDFMGTDFFHSRKRSMREALLAPGASGIIAEYKRRSPSKGLINGQASVYDVSQAYALAGAVACSVLTDEPYFGGHLRDLHEAKTYSPLPILRKDFMIDRYQLYEAKAFGADVILLIAASLSKAEVHALASEAHDLDMEVLFEIHTREELDKLSPHVDMVGVNNRNLKDFSVDIARSIELVQHIPNEFVKVSESGISEVKTVAALREIGYRGFLMGENFMKTDNPGQAAADFIAQLRV